MSEPLGDAPSAGVSQPPGDAPSAGVSEPPGRTPRAAPSPFDALYGLELLSVSEEEVRARVSVRAHHLQPAGAVHGGVLAAMAESMASVATHEAVAGDGMTAAGLSNHASFLRPVTGAAIEGLARRRHRGRGTWVWEAELSDDAGRLCALVRVTVAVRPARLAAAGD